VAILDNREVGGFVMAEQVKAIVFRARRVKRLGKAPGSVLEEVLSILDAVVY
jgi:mRNA-degrading endonuclease toxin of MazEF toxin-antitoxin module